MIPIQYIIRLLPIIAILPVIGLLSKKTLVRRICASLLCLEGLLIFCLLVELTGVVVNMPRVFGTSTLTPWLTVASLFLVCLLVIWKPFAIKQRRIIALSLLAAIIIGTGVDIGLQAYKNSVVEIGDDGEINLSQFMPFGNEAAGDGETLVKTLDEPSKLNFSDGLPRLDGATALYPLYSAFVRATYPEGEYSPYALLESAELSEEEYTTVAACNRTDGAFWNLLEGTADVIFLMDVSAEQAAMAQERGLELQLTPIGREAFVFIVNSRNRVAGLSVDEVKAVYSGEITDWEKIGGGEVRGEIEAYQRQEGSGSQTALQKIMGDTPLMAAKVELVQSLMMGMYNAVANYKNYKNALGYSFRFYIERMLNDAELQKVRLLPINGVAPTVETIADGTYPFADNFFAITVSNRPLNSEDAIQRAENAQKLIAWILTAQGQELVEKTGYVAINGLRAVPARAR